MIFPLWECVSLSASRCISALRGLKLLCNLKSFVVNSQRYFLERKQYICKKQVLSYSCSSYSVLTSSFFELVSPLTSPICLLWLLVN